MTISFLIIYILAIHFKCTKSVSFPSLRKPLASDSSLRNKQGKISITADPLKQSFFSISKLQTIIKGKTNNESSTNGGNSIEKPIKSKGKKVKHETKDHTNEDATNAVNYISDYDVSIINQYLDYKTGKVPPISFSTRIQSYNAQLQNQLKSQLQSYSERLISILPSSSSSTLLKSTSTALNKKNATTTTSGGTPPKFSTPAAATPVYWYYTGVVRNPQTGKEIAGIEGVESVVRLSSAEVKEIVTSLSSSSSSSSTNSKDKRIKKDISKDDKSNGNKQKEIKKSSSVTTETTSTKTATVGYLSKKVFVYTDKSNHSQPLTEFRITPVAPRRPVKPVTIINEIVLLTPLLKSKSSKAIGKSSYSPDESPVVVSATILWPQGRRLSNHKLSLSPPPSSSSSSSSIRTRNSGSSISDNDIESSSLSSPWQKLTRFINGGSSSIDRRNTLEIVNYMRGEIPSNNNNNIYSQYYSNSNDRTNEDGKKKKKKMRWLSFASPLSDRSGRSQEYYTLTAVSGASQSRRSGDATASGLSSSSDVSSASDDKATSVDRKSKQRGGTLSSNSNNNSNSSKPTMPLLRSQLPRPQPRRQQQQRHPVRTHSHHHHQQQEPIESPSHECRFRRFGESPAWYAVGHSHSCVTELVALRHTSTKYFPSSIKRLFIELCTLSSEDSKTASDNSSSGIQSRFINNPAPPTAKTASKSNNNNNSNSNDSNSVNKEDSSIGSSLLQDFNTYCYDPYRSFKPWYRKLF